MKRVILGSLVAATCLTGATAWADDDTGAWYISPMAQYGLLDDKRAAANALGFDIAVGKNFAPHFAGEFNVSNGSYQIHDMESQKLTAFSLDGLFKILPGSIVDPYAIVGAGEMDDIIGRSQVKHQSWMAEGGVGALTGLGAQTGSFRLQLRTEVKYRRRVRSEHRIYPEQPGRRAVRRRLAV